MGRSQIDILHGQWIETEIALVGAQRIAVSNNIQTCHMDSRYSRYPPLVYYAGVRQG